MRFPPLTPRQLREELAKQPSLRRRIARGWILIGSLMVLFVSAMAVAHYVYAMPIQDRDTGQLSTPADTLTMFALLGGGGMLFVVMGVLLNRWTPD